MLKRALTLVGMFAVLTTGAFPSAGACALDTSINHSCCANEEIEPSSSCCSNFDTPEETTAADHAMVCTCGHPASAPGAIPATGGVTDPQVSGQSLDEVDATPSHDISASLIRFVDGRARSHPHPLAHLLNCVNLS